MIQFTTDIASQICAKPIRRAVCVLTAVFFTACTIPHQQAYVTNVDSHLWQSPAVIVIPNTDTTGLYDLHIFLRSNRLLATDTLPMRISTLTPDSILFEERFVFTVSRTRVPSALSPESDVLYRRQVQFARASNYRITISPDIAIEGVEAVGIHLVKNE